MTFMQHLEELRDRLVRAIIAVFLGAAVAFIFRNWIFDVLVQPYENVVDDRLVFFTPTEAFSLFMKLSLFGGFVLASPVIIYQLWRFVGPALTDKEKRYVVPASAVLALLFFGGVLAGYWALDRGLTFLIDFGEGQVDPVINARDYLSFAMRFIIAFGVAFEFPVFLFGAAVIGVVDSKRLKSSRRWAVLIIVVAAALITPSGDPLTLMLLSVPLYVLYELTILAVRFILRR